MSGTGKDNVSITEPSREWTSTNTLALEHVAQYGKDILENPKYRVNSEFDAKAALYSYDQMLQMFQRGYEINGIGPYKRMGKMAVNDEAYFPYDSWASIRNAAGSLKKRYGKQFSIIKLSKRGEPGDICVKRKA